MPKLGKQDQVRAMARSAFDGLSGSSDTIPVEKLRKLLRSIGMSGDNHSLCQALPLVKHQSAGISKEKFVHWVIHQNAEGHGARLNRLLLRYQVGCSRNTSYNLPGAATIFGKPGRTDGVGAAEAIQKWVASKPSEEKKGGVDIIYENKHANIAGCLTVKQANKWRTEYRKRKHEADQRRQKRKMAEAAAAGSGVVEGQIFMSSMRAANEQINQPLGAGPGEIKHPWDRSHTFGKLSKPSEPVGALLTSGYPTGPDPSYVDVSGQTKAGRLPKPRPTNSSTLLTKSSHQKLKPRQKDPSNLFKLSKFKSSR